MRAFITGLAGLVLSHAEQAFLREAQPWGFKEFHICDPFRNIFIFAESLAEEGGTAEQAAG